MNEKWIDEFYDAGEKLYRLNDIQKNILKQNAPEVIFQYRPINKHNIDNIENNVVWARKASEFNDPYDCLYSTEEIDKSIKEAKIKGLDLIARELEDMAIGFEKAGEDIRTGTAVSCFSEKSDSLLMWSHYADQHEGMCVAYDYKEINRISFETIYPVSYGEKINVFCKNENGIRPPTFMVLIRKSLDWSYENEWRILPLLLDKNAEGIVVKVPKPKKVIFGSKVNFNSTLIRPFVEFLMKNEIKCTKMILAKGYFKLLETDM